MADHRGHRRPQKLHEDLSAVTFESNENAFQLLIFQLRILWSRDLPTAIEFFKLESYGNPESTQLNKKFPNLDLSLLLKYLIHTQMN